MECGSCCEALVLVWKVAWAAEGTWGESLYSEALPLHLQPLPFQEQGQSLVQFLLQKLLLRQDGNVSSNCPSKLLAERVPQQDQDLKKTNSKLPFGFQAFCLKVESQSLETGCSRYSLKSPAAMGKQSSKDASPYVQAGFLLPLDLPSSAVSSDPHVSSSSPEGGYPNQAKVSPHLQ